MVRKINTNNNKIEHTKHGAITGRLITETPVIEELTVDQQLLKIVIPRYKENKVKLAELTKLCDDDNKLIKATLLKNNWNKFQAGDTVANYSSYDKVTFNDESLISKIKELGVEGIIKQRDYVDLAALEEAIVNKQINAAELASCQDIKPIVSLQLGKVKKGEDDE